MVTHDLHMDSGDILLGAISSCLHALSRWNSLLDDSASFLHYFMVLFLAHLYGALVMGLIW
jgi:hypothetical protein